MLEQILIAGISGFVIIAYISGLGIFIKVIKAVDKKTGLKSALKNNVKGLFSYLLLFCFILLTLIIILGLASSVLNDLGSI